MVRKAEAPFYFVCENCTCKFFNDVSPCGCPRCGETLVSTERIQPPWKIRMHSVAETAEILRCSESTVYNLIETGKLAHHRCPGIRISQDQIADYLEETKRERREPQPRKSQPHRPRLRNIKV